MHDRDRFVIWKTLFALGVVLLLASPAMAYVVPGLGPDFMAQFVGLVMWIVVAFSSVMLWPVYALIRYFRRKKAAPTPAEQPTEAPESQMIAPPAQSPNG